MATDTTPYLEAAKTTLAPWAVGLLLGIGFLWTLVAGDGIMVTVMLGVAAAVAVGYAANTTRSRAKVRRVRDSREA